MMYKTLCSKTRLNRKILTDSVTKEIFASNKRKFASGADTYRVVTPVKNENQDHERRKRLRNLVENTMGKLTRNKYHKIGEKYVNYRQPPESLHNRSSLQDDKLAIYKDRKTYGRL